MQPRPATALWLQAGWRCGVGFCATIVIALLASPVSSEPPPPGPVARHGPSTGARYPIHATAYITRFPEPEGDFEAPPTLAELNKIRPYDFDPRAGLSLDTFTLFTVDDLGFHDPAQQEYLRLTGRDLLNGDYHLVVHLRGAPAITDCFFYVRYHQEQWHPRQIEPGSAFGMEGDRLWFGKLDIPGVVCAGMTRIRPDLNGGIKLEDGVICEIVFEEKPYDYKPWWLERAPNEPRNQPANAGVYEDPEDCCVTFYWEEVNCGDLNNDGEVSLVDIIPVGRRYGRISTDAVEDEWDHFPDANDDGEVNYRDAWALEDNYGALLQGYRVYRRRAHQLEADEVLLPHHTAPLLPMSIHRPKTWNPIRRISYRYRDPTLPRTAGPVDWIYRIVPYNALNDVEGEDSALEITVRVSTLSVTVH